MYTIAKEFHFSASHQLKGLPPDHPCSRLHGHNYVIVITLRSETLNNIGFVMDYRELQPVKELLDNSFDHRHFNDLMVENPTAENIAKLVYDAIRGKFQEIAKYLYSVEVRETPKTSAVYCPDLRGGHHE